MPRAFTEQEQAGVKRKLIDEAARIFAAQGIRNASIDQIVQACGIAKGSFYRFFASKEELAFALLAEIETAEQTGILGKISRAAELRGALTVVLDASLTLVGRHPIIARFNDPQEIWWLMMRAGDSQKAAMRDRDLVFCEDIIQLCLSKGWRLSVDAAELTLIGRYLMGLSLLPGGAQGGHSLIPPELNKALGEKVRNTIRDGIIDKLLKEPDQTGGGSQ